MKIWQCDRCKKVYEENNNNVLDELIHPALKGYDFEKQACYIKISSKTFTTETLPYNFCDDCMCDLCRWIKGEV